MNKENSNIPQEKEEDKAQLQSGKTTKDESSSQYISTLYEIRKYSGEQYDKLIVYLSSGALVLTVGFVEKVVDLSKIKNLFFCIFLGDSLFFL